jgi:hypothetical protein
MSKEDYHTFIPGPNQSCLICEMAEHAVCHRRTRASAHRDSLLSGANSPFHSKSRLSNIATKTDQPEAAGDISSKNTRGGEGKSGDGGRGGEGEGEEGEDHLGEDPNGDENGSIDQIEDIYTWGELTRLGPCKNQHYRDNKEHKDASVRKLPGTHLHPINRASHPLAYTVPLELGQVPKSKTIVQMVGSEKHTLLVTDCGQIHAFKECTGKYAVKENILSRVQLRTQVLMVSAGMSHFVAIASIPKDNLLVWGMNHYGQLGMPIKGKQGKKSKKNMLKSPTALEFEGDNRSKNISESKTKTKTKKKKNRSIVTEEKDDIMKEVPPFVSVTCGPMTTFAIGSDGRLWSWGYDGHHGVLGRGKMQQHKRRVKFRYDHDAEMLDNDDGDNNNSEESEENEEKRGKRTDRIDRRASFLRNRSHLDSFSSAFVDDRDAETKEVGNSSNSRNQTKHIKEKNKKMKKKKKKDSSGISVAPPPVCYPPAPNEALMTYLNMSMLRKTQKQQDSESSEVNAQEEDSDDEEGREGAARDAMFKRAYDGWSDNYCRRMVETTRFHPMEWATAHKPALGGLSMAASGVSYSSSNLQVATFRLEKVMENEERAAWQAQDEQRTTVSLTFKGCLHLELEDRAVAKRNKRSARGLTFSQTSERAGRMGSKLVASVVDIGVENLSQNVDPTTVVTLMKKKEIRNPDRQVQIVRMEEVQTVIDRLSTNRAKKMLTKWSSIMMKVYYIQDEHGTKVSNKDPTAHECQTILSKRSLIEGGLLTTIVFREIDHFDMTFRLTSLQPRVSFGAMPISPNDADPYAIVPDVPVGPNIPGVAVQHGWILYVLDAFWFVHNAGGILPPLFVDSNKSKDETGVSKSSDNVTQNKTLKRVKQEGQPITKLGKSSFDQVGSIDDDDDVIPITELHSDIFGSGRGLLPSTQLHVKRLKVGDILQIGQTNDMNHSICVRFSTSMPPSPDWSEYDQLVQQYQSGRAQKPMSPPRKPYRNAAHNMRFIRQSIVAASVTIERKKCKQKRKQQLLQVGRKAQTHLQQDALHSQLFSVPQNTDEENDQKFTNTTTTAAAAAAVASTTADANPLLELTIQQRKEIAKLAYKADLYKQELIEAEELILDIRQRPSTVSAERRARVIRQGKNIRNGNLSAVVAAVNQEDQEGKKEGENHVGGRNQSNKQKQMRHAKQSSVKTIPPKDQYEKDITKAGALQLVKDKELAATQHSIAIRHLKQEITNYENLVKEKDTTLQQNM